MKKFLFILMAFVATMVAKAEDYELYAVGTVTPNGENTISLMIKNKEPLQMVQGEITTPAGFTIESISSTCAIAGDGNYVSNGNFRFLFNAMTDVCIPASNEPQEIAKLTVTCTNLPTGQIQLINTGCKLAMYPSADPAQDSYEDIISYVKVQKAAVIEELGDGNFVSIVPVAMKPGFYADGNVTALDIYYTSKTDLAGLSFNLNLPHAEFYSSAFDKDGNPVEAVLNNAVYNNSAKTLSVETTDDQNLKFTYAGVKTTRAANQRYIKATDVPTKLATIYIESEESLPVDIYTLTLSDITLEEYVTSGTGTLHTGKNYSTIVVGTPEQTEGIIYGYCTSSAASEISSVLKNVAIIDVTSATVDENVKFSDVIVNTKDGSYYSRTSANYGTTCLPYSLTGEFYTVKEMTASSIILEEVTTTTPNEPYIFKGTIDATDANQVTTLGAAGQKSVSTTTFKGTYSATNIAAGAGYYIATDGKFYSDGATVRPFRAYFDGAVAGVKSFNVLIDSANGLIDITDQLSEDAIYSLQGIRTQSAKKGVNIIGGKKVYVK